MLKELFEAHFYRTFRKVENKVLMLDERTVSGDFSLLDSFACQGCKYVKDKRQKARRQLHNTLVLLFANPIIGEHINNKLLRYAVFSWKETFPENEEMDSVERSMMEMTLMTDEVYSPDNESNFSYGFKLREIRYPDVLICA